MEKKELFWQTYLNLEKELLEVSKYIYVTDEITENGISKSCTTQLGTFSSHIADLIIRTCIEIEAISKEIYYDIVESKPENSGELYFDTDCLKLIEKTYNTDSKKVIVTCLFFNLKNDANKTFKPLKKAHYKKGTKWEEAYQALKHDRYSSLSHATIRNLIHSLGALFLLNIYYKKPTICVKRFDVDNIDYSFGSSIFSVARPSQKYVSDVINGEEFKDILRSNDSPFILKYTNSAYNNIIEAHNKSQEEKKNYYLAQPESKEQEFLDILHTKLKLQESYIYACELFKYRLNKKLPSTMPFEERKKAFLLSPEWNARSRNNKHRLESELTIDNLQSEIDQTAIHMGYTIEKKFEEPKIELAFKKAYCEILIDNGKIRYD